MISLSVVNDVEYFHSMSSEHAVEYFSENQKVDGFWQGQLATKEGLIGKEVTQQDVERIAGMVKNGERLGLNITYSAPKSVSIAYAILGDDRIKEAHEHAVRVTNEYIEKNLAETRQGQGGKERVQASGVAIANYTHETSRSHDPQVHTHAVILNAVERSTDGKIRALEPQKIFQYQKALDQVYKNELASKLQELGYAIEMKDKNGNFEIKGIDQKIIDKFSERSQQIENAMEKIKNEINTNNKYKIRDIAAIESRDKKEFLSKEELNQKWNGKLSDLRLTKENIKQSIESAKTETKEINKIDVKEYIKKACDMIHENESAFNKEKLTEVALRLSMSQSGNNEKVITQKEVERAIEELKKEKYITDLKNGYLTTKEMQQIEKEVINYINKTNGTAKAIETDVNKIDAAIKEYEQKAGYQMTNDQRAAVHHILQSQDKVIGIQGDAGTGKTTVFQNIREEMEKKGYTVRGITPTGKAADVMSNEAGIKTQTVDSFLMKFSQMKIVDNKEDWKNHDKVIEKGKEVWVVDETSMMGSKEVHDLIDKAKQADARVIFCGDTKQLKSVEAGQIFKDMQQKGMNTIKMTEKVRQKDIEYKKTVDALGKKEWNTVKEKMEKQNKIKEIQNREERINEIKKDFLSGDHSKILITTATNRDKNELNSQIRNELKNQGKLGDGYKFTVRESKNLSSEEKRFAFSYSVGDTVFANRNDLQNMGIKSKTNEFVVSGVNISKNEITIKNANGKEFVINTKEHSDKFSVYQTKEIEISKNDRVITLKNDKQHGIKNGEMWQVKSIDSQGNITIKNNDKEKTINIKDYNYVDHSYAVTTHKSQGMTVNKVISDVSSQRTNYNEVYTAVTRGKTDYMIFTDNKEKFFDRMQNEQAKTTTLESTKTIELRTTEKTETKTMSSERTSTTEKTTETRDMTTSMDRGR